MDKGRLVNITLDERTLVRRSPEVEHERAVAVFDLLEENTFVPLGANEEEQKLLDFGPFSLHLGVEENRLKLEIRDDQDAAVLATVQLSLSPFRRIVKDYFTVCESYFEAIKTASPSRIEAIDMGRRGLHNEGAALLKARLEDKIELDENTARRLFTLVCVLHIKG